MFKKSTCNFFWPKLSFDLAELISHCPVCLKYSHSNQKEPLINHPIPDRPWQVVATDLFQWDKKDFLLVVDYYSCFFDIAQLQNTTSISVINKMKPMFARYGIPERVISDNGPQYSSQEFKDFARKYNFEHVTSSPYHPKSNGFEMF